MKTVANTHVLDGRSDGFLTADLVRRPGEPDGSERRAANRCRPNLTLINVLRMLPPDQVREHIIKVHPSVLAGLLSMSKDSHLLFGDAYFRSTFGTRDVCRPEPRANFRLELPGAVARALMKSEAGGVLPYHLIALANGYVNRYLDQERFDRVLALLRKPPVERSVQELQRVGITVSRFQQGYLSQDWTIIGLVSGVMDMEDFLGLDMISTSLPMAFWSRRFPQAGNARLPDILPEDWMQVGYACESADYAPESDYRRAKSTLPSVTLDRIRRTSYFDRYHYVACVVSRRLFGTPVGPFTCSADAGSTLQTACNIFKLRVAKNGCSALGGRSSPLPSRSRITSTSAPGGACLEPGARVNSIDGKKEGSCQIL